MDVTHRQSEICIQVIQSVLPVSQKHPRKIVRGNNTIMKILICKCRQCNIKIFCLGHFELFVIYYKMYYLIICDTYIH